jgi:hypothetical protein
LRLERLEDRAVPASLSYSTYFGTVNAVAVDSAGDAYVTGNGFVAKLNATGTAVLYNMSLNGGTGTGIALDAAGDAFVIGFGGNIPTTPNAIASSGGTNIPAQDDFVAELNPTGTAFLYASYLPGTVNDPSILGYSGAIAVDGSGNIDVAGTAEAGLPVTAGAFQTAYLGSSGGSNAFFMKIDPALSATASVLYATYLGGNGPLGDEATAIALDASGNAYLEGFTTSRNFPTTSGAFDRAFGAGGNWGHVFVAKIDPALSGAASLVYSTYLGGSGSEGYVPDQAVIVANQIDGGIAVDSAGNAYVTSATTSADFPTTPGAYQTSSNIQNPGSNLDSPSDVFVTKLNATGSALIYSTYLGGGTNASSGGKHGGKGGRTASTPTNSGGTGIAVDAIGNAYVTGWTNSTHFPVVNALQPTNAGGYDAFVTVLNPSGSGLLFSSYFGGSSSDYGFGIALDSAGNAYVGGQTSPSNFPTTPGAFNTTGGYGFGLKIDPPADTAEVSVPILTGDTIGTAGGVSPNGANGLLSERFLPSAPVIDFFRASPGISTSGPLLGYATRNADETGRILTDAQDSYGVFGDPFGLDPMAQ